MKKTFKSTMLLCLVVFVLLSAVSCNLIPGFTEFETTTPLETTAESTPEGTTPEITTPEETTPEVTTPEVTTPEETTPEITTPEITTPEITTPEITTPDDDPSDDPIIDLDGYVYRAYVRSNAITGGSPMDDGNPNFFCEDFWYNPNKGEPEDALSYAVYMRNMAIEEELNVKIEQVPQTMNMVQEMCMFYQNNDKFDLTIILAKSGAQAATMNLLQDLNSMPGLMLEEPFYDQNSIRELSMAGKLYYLSGDMNISTMDCLTPTVVNMELYDNYVESIVEYFDYDPLYANIYNVVASGKWTVDTMLSIAALASVDADTTDGALGSSECDQIGYFQYAVSTLYYFYGAGGRLTEINENGVPEFVIQKRQNEEIFNYLFDCMNKNNRDVPYPYGWSGVRKTNFVTNGNTLFTEMSLWDIRKDLYMNGTFEYGILPTPTYTEGGDYHSVVYFSNLAHLWAIPRLCNDEFMAQVMMATMAAASDIELTGSTMDAYYTRTLSFTIAPDPNARAVMDIIKNSTVYDIALLYNWGGWGTELEKLGESRYNNYGALVSAMPNGAIPELEDTIELFRNPGSIID